MPSSDVLIVTVRQPWASALFGPKRTRKSIENRKWPVSGGSGWICIRSSKSAPKRSDIQDARRRIIQSAGDLNAIDFDAMPRGAILGLVYVEECITSDTPINVWHNAGDCGWVITKTAKLPQPFQIDPTDKAQTKVWLSKRPSYLAKLRHQLPTHAALS